MWTMLFFICTPTACMATTGDTDLPSFTECRATADYTIALAERRWPEYIYQSVCVLAGQPT
jgi:hypothetical protein